MLHHSIDEQEMMFKEDPTNPFCNPLMTEYEKR
jgi:hypothetical protein